MNQECGGGTSPLIHEMNQELEGGITPLLTDVNRDGGNGTSPLLVHEKIQNMRVEQVLYYVVMGTV